MSQAFTRLVALNRALGATAGRAALEQSLPLYMTIIVGAAMVFEHNGLEPSRVIDAACSDAWIRGTLWLYWLTISYPAARAVFCTPSASWLRSLPIPRWQLIGSQSLFLLLVEFPWFALWLRGGGILMGLGAFLVAASAHAAVIARARSTTDCVLMATVGVVAMGPSSPWIQLIVSVPLAIREIRVAWLRGPEHRTIRRVRLVFGRSQLTTLTTAAFAALWRGCPALMSRLFLVTGLGAMLGALAARNRDPSEFSERTSIVLALLVPASIIISTSLMGNLRRMQVAEQWLYRSGGVAITLQNLANAICVLLIVSLAGLMHGLVASLVACTDLASSMLLMLECAASSIAFAIPSIRVAQVVFRPAVSVSAQLLVAGGYLALTALAAPQVLDVVLGLELGLALIAFIFSWRTARDTWPRNHRKNRDNTMLQVVDICKRLGRIKVLTHVSFACERGELAVILGKNGAGKSTLLRVLAGIVEPDSGTMELNGEPMQAKGAKARQRIGYVPDLTDGFPQLFVSEFLHLTRTLKCLPETVEQSGLYERLGIDATLSQRMGSLSFGQAKRVYIAAAMLGEPELLMLDEPSNGLDAAGTEVLVEMLHTRSSGNLATILSTNDLGFATRIGGTQLRIVDGSVRKTPAVETIAASVSN